MVVRECTNRRGKCHAARAGLQKMGRSNGYVVFAHVDIALIPKISTVYLRTVKFLPKPNIHTYYGIPTHFTSNEYKFGFCAKCDRSLYKVSLPDFHKHVIADFSNTGIYAMLADGKVVSEEDWSIALKKSAAANWLKFDNIACAEKYYREGGETKQIKAAKKKYYAVAIPPFGVTNSIKKVKEVTKGQKVAMWAKFKTWTEADEFYSYYGGTAKLVQESNVSERLKKFGNVDWSKAHTVYTGACSKDGRNGAKAGYGVYWGAGSPDNESGPVYGEATNNRGELLAVKIAIGQAVLKRLPSLVIGTESMLLIKSCDIWMDNWKKNKWMTESEEPVKNQDLLKDIDALLNKIPVKIVKIWTREHFQNWNKVRLMAMKCVHFD